MWGVKCKILNAASVPCMLELYFIPKKTLGVWGCRAAEVGGVMQDNNGACILSDMSNVTSLIL